MRLSWDGAHVRQLCDPNNEETGKLTGAVSDAVLSVWGEMKTAHWIDAQREQLRELKRNRSFERPSRRNGEDRGSLGV